MTLEISEHTHARQELVVVGTALIRGEDLPSIGRIYIFAIIDVVPEPDRPATGRKLKPIAKEDVKGAVTTLSEIGSQGFLLASHGQKCMVRGLKEDGSLLPVAFMDMQCYSTVAKELRGTGLCLMGDIIKGVWLTGYYVRGHISSCQAFTRNSLIVHAGGTLPAAILQQILAAYGGDGRGFSSRWETIIHCRCRLGL